MESTQRGINAFRAERTGSSDMSSQWGTSVERSRRVWSLREEELLVTAMKEIIAQGQKSDNGFRAGYLKKLEVIFKNHLPGTDLRGMPHINSKLTTWKKEYYSLSTLLGYSGVGFNLFGTYTVDCDEALWVTIKLTVKDANKIRARKWPFYYDWKEIFGRDRATGDGGEHIEEAINEIEEEAPATNDDNTNGDYRVNLNQIRSVDVEEDSVSQPGMPAHKPEHESKYKSKKSVPNAGDNSSSHSQQPERNRTNMKKRKAPAEGIEKVCELLSEINRTNASRWETMATQITYEYQLGQARLGIFEQLGSIQGLSNIHKFTVCELLGASKEKLETFLSLPETARPEYVHHLLTSS